MGKWSEAKECYINGGITQRELSQEFELPLGAVRKRASQENWVELRKKQQSLKAQEGELIPDSRAERQLALTDRLMDIIEAFFNNDDELFSWTEARKTGGDTCFVTERLNQLNDARFARMVKLAEEVIDLQRRVMGIPDYRNELSARKLQSDSEFANRKLRNDSQLANRKLRQQTELASRKLEIELLKLEGAQTNAVSGDNFLAALGFEEVDCDGEEQD